VEIAVIAAQIDPVAVTAVVEDILSEFDIVYLK
jgi:hypothetical protein